MYAAITIPRPTQDAVEQVYLPGTVPSPVQIMEDHEHNIKAALRCMVRFYDIDDSYRLTTGMDTVWQHPAIKVGNEALSTDYDRDMNHVFCDLLHDPDTGEYALLLGRIGNTITITIKACIERGNS